MCSNYERGEREPGTQFIVTVRNFRVSSRIYERKYQSWLETSGVFDYVPEVKHAKKECAANFTIFKPA